MRADNPLKLPYQQIHSEFSYNLHTLTKLAKILFFINLEIAYYSHIASEGEREANHTGSTKALRFDWLTFVLDVLGKGLAIGAEREASEP